MPMLVSLLRKYLRRLRLDNAVARNPGAAGTEPAALYSFVDSRSPALGDRYIRVQPYHAPMAVDSR